MQHKIDFLMNEADVQKTSDLKNIESIQNEISKLNKTHEDLDMQIQNYKKMEKCLNDEKSKLTTKLNDEEKLNDDLSEQIGKYIEIEKGLSDENVQLKFDLVLAKEKNVELEGKVNDLSEEIKTAKSKI